MGGDGEGGDDGKWRGWREKERGREKGRGGGMREGGVGKV